jgi:hypothetical protein
MIVIPPEDPNERQPDPAEEALANAFSDQLSAVSFSESWLNAES